METDTRSRAWQFWIDRGGTFTDVIGAAPDGRLHLRKVLSDAHGSEDSGLAAIREILAAQAPGARVGALKVGTTVATNALLERAGEPVALVATRGFADQLAIGSQERPDIFARHIVRPAPLHALVLEAAERVDCAGRVLEPLDEAGLERALLEVRARGFDAVAIAFLHGWQHERHESLAGALARRCGFSQVSVSHAVAPIVRYVARADTTVLDAYLTPPLDRYVARLEADLAGLDAAARLYFMQSGGGLAAAAAFDAAASLLSGPAGGLAALWHMAGTPDCERLIGFDMGGTSTDVSLVDGELPLRFEHEIAGIRLQRPMLDIHSIAAGGGSIVELHDGRLVVGPRSAGARPGPACYGRGGPLAVTDLQVALGRLRPEFLPAVFGPGGRQSIEPDAAGRRLDALTSAVCLASPQATPESVAVAALEVAVESMAHAIRHVATRAGADPADFTLVAFGGAGGQHACRVATACGIRRILVHPLASVLSAFGIGVADRLAVRRESLRLTLGVASWDAAGRRMQALGTAAATELADGVGDAGSVALRYVLEIRAGDSETTLDVAMPAEGGPPGAWSPAREHEVRQAFAALHRRRFGYDDPGRDLVIEHLRAEARISRAAGGLEICDPTPLELPASARAWFDGWTDAPVLDLRRLAQPVTGPALLVEPRSTVVVERGWAARLGADGVLLLEAAPSAVRTVVGEDAPSRAAAQTLDPARIELYNGLFMHVANEMGAVLRQTAQSVNIRERLDYSCALFDDRGRLVANAPHMPVHLGSMGTSVRAVIDAAAGSLRPGDAWMLNSPYAGGTHLPDVTVVTPVFCGTPAPAFFVASRAHHADIGGATPGSMPPFSRTIHEEGVLFEPFQLVAAGALREREVRSRLEAGRWPARNVGQNLADLRAQLAANARGVAELRRAVGRHGALALADAMGDVQRNAAECVRRAIRQLDSGHFVVELDGGERIAVRIDVDRAASRARIDFGGTSPAGPHNFNAPRAVTFAAVLYVFRTLVERPIPLNEGCLEPLDIVIPPGSMLDPAEPAAVVAGNVETSQSIVDALYGALGMLAASQGTMNNLTFGDDRLQYYETIAGGSGAGAGFCGCDAVQTHMTNSRLTDPEILEGRYPVLVREFAIRRGSGGAGRFRGGDGVVRRLEFRAPLSGAMLANRRRIPPFGLAGGGAAQPGITRIRRADGTVTECGACASFDLATGDVVEILTPGGGGFGAQAP